MFENIFLQILNMSFTSSIVILFVLLARLLLKKAPKIFSYSLWSIVLFRLLCPFSFESILSLLPTKAQPIPQDILQQATPQIDTGIPVIDQNINPILPSPIITETTTFHPLQFWTTFGMILWGIGILVLLCASLISLIKLRRNLVGAVRSFDNVYLSDNIPSPFVVGILRPKIYFPSSIEESEEDYILLHEKTHIRRLDHIIKPVAFCAVILHWFNPLAWLAFVLACKDMEMSCDESVMRHLNADIRHAYSASLFHLATGRRIIAPTPLAFGEGNAKARIKNILSYRKPAFWLITTALIIVIILCIGLITNPKNNHEDAITFPAYQDGKEDYNATTYEINSFLLNIDLPEGWEVELASPSERAPSSIYTPVYLMENGVRMATVGYNVLGLCNNENATEEYLFDQMYYQLSNDDRYFWSNYTPITSTATAETALAAVHVGKWGGVGEKDVPGILSYNKDLGVYVAIRFETDTVVTEEQYRKMAESIRLTPHPQATESARIKLVEYTVAKSEVTLQDGSTVTLRVIVRDGWFFSSNTTFRNNELGEGIYVGICDLSVSKQDNLYPRISLDQASGYSHQFTFNNTDFPIQFADYNEDGNPDFALGQPKDEHNYAYSLFTIVPGVDGAEISPLSDGLSVISNSREYSPLFSHSDQKLYVTQYLPESRRTAEVTYALNEYQTLFYPEELLKPLEQTPLTIYYEYFNRHNHVSYLINQFEDNIGFSDKAMGYYALCDAIMESSQPIDYEIGIPKEVVDEVCVKRFGKTVEEYTGSVMQLDSGNITFVGSSPSPKMFILKDLKTESNGSQTAVFYVLSYYTDAYISKSLERALLQGNDFDKLAYQVDLVEMNFYVVEESDRNWYLRYHKIKSLGEATAPYTVYQQ